MSYKNTKFRFIAQLMLVLFITNNTAPTLQFAFADSTQYYVDATSGNDGNDGLTPGTAWQTVAQVNSTSLLQGDTVSFLCTDTWNEVLTINSTNGSALLPITVNSYGGSCGANKPKLDGINITISSQINITNIELPTPIVGNSVNISGSNIVSLSNSTITNGSGICLNITNSTGTTVTWNSFTNCDYAFNVNASEVSIATNTFSAIAQDALTISSSFPVTVSQNTFTNIAQNAIIYGQDTDITQNSIVNSCSTGSTHCAAIKNNPSLSGATVTSTISQNTISGVGSGISGTGSYGILSYNVVWAIINLNNVVNAENALRIIDANTLTITNNNFLTSRAKSILVTQENTWLTHTNTFNTNTILQKNPDYPYIEMRDEVDGSDQSSIFLTANSNTIYPNYKPNTSYVRSVDFGGHTNEYTKNMLNQFDSNIVKFEYFAYKPYTNTGSYATANLLSNQNFDTDASGWSVDADIWLAPVLSHNPVGSNIGGSATVTPSGGVADRIWLTSNDVLNITAGQTYLVTWYARSSSGNINLRAFLHQSGDRTNIYSDRIAETYASSTGWMFSFYVTIKTTAADANITFETSNQNVNLEVDGMSIRRMNAVIKNTNPQETLIFSNTGAASYDQACPGGACFAYVDGVNASIAWPTTIPAYTTRFVLLNNSPNILNTPTIVLNISAGSVPTGQPVTIDWTTTNADSQILNYATYTGSFSTPVASVGTLTFIPPYDTNSTISIDALNDVWPRQASIQVTTTNTAPSIFPTTTVGLEDASQIDGTMSGVDLNPGDSVTFETFGGNNVANGSLTYDSSGSIQYYPSPDFCGTDDFSFRAADQLWHQADPVVHTIQVDCVNDTPVAVNDSWSAFAGIPLMINVLTNDTDVDTPYQVQTFTISGISMPSNGTLSINSNQLQYTPNLGYSGTDVFSYSMSDQSWALSNTGTVTVSVTISNTPPTVAWTGYTLNEDASLISTLTWSDYEGNPLTYTASILPSNGTLVLLPGGSFTYTPTSNYFWSDSFDFIANDGMINSAPATVTLTIDPVFDAPTTVPDSYSLTQDTTFFVPVMMNDIDPDSTVLTLTGYTNPANGTLVVSGTGFDYTPNTGYIGWDSFTYQIIDDTALTSNISTVTLTVTTSNTPPTANSGSFSVNEDGVLTGGITGTDPQWSTLTYIVDTPPTQGAFSISATGAFTYTPSANYFGSDSFVFHVSDGMLDSSGAIINITVNSVNDAPIANPMSFTATGNSMASSGNLYIGAMTASDIEWGSLSFTATTLPIHGVFSVTSTGAFTYLPALGYTWPDSFTFTVSDGVATSASATVNITIVSNGVVLPQTLDHFTISAPSTAYLGQAFNISVQARDSSNIIFSGYTGSIIFASPTDTGATLPWSWSPIVFSALDGGTKTFVNGVNFTKTGVMTFTIQDWATGISASSVVTVSIQPPPSVSSSVPGAWWGGGQTSPAVTYNVISVANTGETIKIPSPTPITPTWENPIFNSAPVGQMETVFVMNDPTGLLGQLFLTNRFMGGNPINETPSPIGMDPAWSNNQAALDIIDSLDMLILDDTGWPVILRQIARLFAQEVNRSDDPIGLYEYATAKIEQIQVSEGTRLAFTREYILRIFEQQRKKYEDEVYRMAYTGFDDTMNSASEEIGELDF